jgi:hypothetical protein
MKNTILFSIVILLLMTGCTSRDSKSLDESTGEGSSKPLKLIVSIPSVVLSKVFGDSAWLEKTPGTNLKVLWDYDLEFSEDLAKAKSLGPRQLTRKVNPCCPCDGTGSGCCACPKSLYFGSSKSMETKLTFDNSLLEPNYSDGVDLYEIPANTEDGTYEVVINVKNIDTPFRFNVQIRDGIIDF